MQSDFYGFSALGAEGWLDVREIEHGVKPFLARPSELEDDAMRGIVERLL